MTYGYEVQDRDDRMLDASKRMSNFAQEKILPGALLVNYLSFRMKSRRFHDSIDLHVHSSKLHPRMAAMAELQATSAYWL
jgi:hypothetical protein